jgi:hypothetical protein
MHSALLKPSPMAPAHYAGAWTQQRAIGPENALFGAYSVLSEIRHGEVQLARTHKRFDHGPIAQRDARNHSGG